MKKEVHFLFSRASGTNTKKVDWLDWKIKSIYSIYHFYFFISVNKMRFYIYICNTKMYELKELFQIGL
jgi:hypothetical protein